MIAASSIKTIGSDLARPECVVTTKSGDIFVSDKRGGISQISADGTTKLFQARNAPEGFLPNGFALLPDRSFLIANLGPDGGVYHLTQDGTLTKRVREVDGKQLPPTNWVGIDKQDRMWISVSTWTIPREKAARQDIANGFVVLVDDKGPRIVAEGIGYTNECVVDKTGKWLYVSESIARCTSRFPINEDGSLGPKEVLASFGEGTFPDGFALDIEGGFWVVSVISNRIIHVDSKGNQTIVLEDSDPAVVAAAEQAFQENRYGRKEMDSGANRSLRNLSSIAFGGPDLRTGYLGSLFGDKVFTYPSPVTGEEPVHWNF